MADFSFSSPTSLQIESLIIEDNSYNLTFTPIIFSGNAIDSHSFVANASTSTPLALYSSIPFSFSSPSKMIDYNKRPAEGQIYPRRL